MAKELTLLERIKRSKKEFMKWPKARRETALKEVNISASYVERILQMQRERNGQKLNS